MNCSEFSNLFDTLLNSYASTILFGNLDSSTINLDEYEKSVFLTKAQEEIVKDLYSGRITGESFESSEKLRRELLILISQKEYVSNNTNSQLVEDESKILEDKFNHVVCTLPEKILYIVYEQVKLDSSKCSTGLIADVYPTTHDEYWRILNNPFRGPNSRRVLRLDRGEHLVELVSNSKINTYTIRYLRCPEPINLVDKEDEDIACELDESLHRIILDRAVRYALISKNINIKDSGNN